MSSQRIPTTGPSSLRPTGFAETILIITILLGLFCMIAVVPRTWQRIRDRSFHVDDGVTWLGLQIFNLIHTLLRINNGTGHRKTTWALWLIMIVVAASSTASFLYYVVRCDPFSGCRDSAYTILVIYFLWVAVYILVDIALAAVPLFMIRGLNMQKSLKLSLGVILAMGGIACLASIIRIPSRLENTGGSDEGYRFGSVILWSVVETGLSIIACCLPMMRKLLRSFDTDGASVAQGRPAYYQPGSSGHSGHSGQTPSNNNRHLLHQSSLSSDQEKGPNAV
ncbi:hypothetical protein INS49_015793 [Diaporthe citri]|uniref:uncharacterized protein n=1 Tax=Diaporthe citri TaxID=83186 RepID=UPI001C821B16|nr:uncharacterized protein INS49_015793 [Diaporthe citri]KAG6356405.1 hypothetical protein INS49_015793 [Diaporthe citri]